MKCTKYSIKAITEKAEYKDFSKHLCSPPVFSQRIEFYRYCLLWLERLKAPPWWLRKGCKNFSPQNSLDCWKTHVQSKKYWKYIPLWSAFLVDNVLGIELQQLQWNMSYWNDKRQGLSFETQLKIKFLPPNNSSKKCLEKSLLSQILKKSGVEFFWFWPIIPHDLSDFIGIVCFYFFRNLLQSLQYF